MYRVLPTYGVGALNFTGLVIENRGQATAHKMRVKLSDIGATIQDMQIESEESPTIEDGGKGADRLTFLLERFLGGSPATVYMTTDQPVRLEGRVSILAEEGRAIPASQSTGFSALFMVQLGLLATIMLGAAAEVVLTRLVGSRGKS